MRASVRREVGCPKGKLLPRQESFASLHILTRRASEGSEALPSLARRVSMSFFGARVIPVALGFFFELADHHRMNVQARYDDRRPFWNELCLQLDSLGLEMDASKSIAPRELDLNPVG